MSSSVGNPLDEGPLDVSHSLMAACDDGKDDLQTLFDLAETVFGQPDDPNSDPQHCHDMVNLLGILTAQCVVHSGTPHKGHP